MQNEKSISESNVQWPIAIFIILLSCVFLFPPEYLLARQISRYAVHWMFICLGLGIVFMFLNLEKLLYTSFICSGILASFLLYSYNSSINHASDRGGELISVAFVNPSLSTINYNNTIDLLKKQNADIMVLEEITPDWKNLIDSLKSLYKYSVIINRVDPYGKAIFSKFNLESIDTIQLFNNPIIIANAKIQEGKNIFIAAINALPSVTMSDFKKLNSLLDQVSKIILHLNSSILLAANLNLVPWTKELRNFKLESKLNSSRRDNNDGSFDSNIWNLFNIPKNEIYYSEDLECSYFNEINDYNSNPIGLIASYQFKKKIVNNNK